MRWLREDDRLRVRARTECSNACAPGSCWRGSSLPPATVLDVGGGTGVHAEWPAEQGYGVHLIDPVEEHVAAGAGLPGVAAAVGDARSVPHADASQDAALLLGPLQRCRFRGHPFVRLRRRQLSLVA